MNIQTLIKNMFVPITGNALDAETIANALFDKVIDKLPSDLANEDVDQKLRVAVTEVLFEELVNKMI